MLYPERYLRMILVICYVCIGGQKLIKIDSCCNSFLINLFQQTAKGGREAGKFGKVEARLGREAVPAMTTSLSGKTIVELAKCG